MDTTGKLTRPNPWSSTVDRHPSAAYKYAGMTPMSRRGRLRQALLTAGLVIVMAACVPLCGIGAKFALSNAKVDATYKCPYPATDAPYKVHASIDADNSTTNAVTIKTMSEDNALVSTAGQWSGPKTGKGNGPITDFSPKSIASGDKSTIHFTVGFVCTNSGPNVTTYGDFTFKFTLVTSAGTYKIDAGNHHRLTFAAR